MDNKMNDKMNPNNHVCMAGEIASGFTFSHKAFGERIYQMMVTVRRLSRQVDILPVMVPENQTVLDIHKDYTGRSVMIFGWLHSYNWRDELGMHLKLAVSVYQIKLCDDLPETITNQISLDGFICKKPVYRKTPRGREITDLLMAVNRPSGQSDYIPCIVWGYHARRASCYEIGNHVELRGRMQSREYTKKLSESEAEVRVAYEVSANYIK